MCGVLDSGFTKEGIWKELVYVYNRKTQQAWGRMLCNGSRFIKQDYK